MNLQPLYDARRWAAFTELPVWGFLFAGLQTTLLMAVIAIAVSLVLGLALALLRLSRFPLLSWPATLFIEIVRALPVLLLIFFASLWPPGRSRSRFTPRASTQRSCGRGSSRSSGGRWRRRGRWG